MPYGRTVYRNDCTPTCNLGAGPRRRTCLRAADRIGVHLTLFSTESIFRWWSSQFDGLGSPIESALSKSHQLILSSRFRGSSYQGSLRLSSLGFGSSTTLNPKHAPRRLR